MHVNHMREELRAWDVFRSGGENRDSRIESRRHGGSCQGPTSDGVRPQRKTEIRAAFRALLGMMAVEPTLARALPRDRPRER